MYGSLTIFFLNTSNISLYLWRKICIQHLITPNQISQKVLIPPKSPFYSKKIIYLLMVPKFKSAYYPWSDFLKLYSSRKQSRVPFSTSTNIELQTFKLLISPLCLKRDLLHNWRLKEQRHIFEGLLQNKKNITSSTVLCLCFYKYMLLPWFVYICSVCWNMVYCQSSDFCPSAVNIIYAEKIIPFLLDQNFSLQNYAHQQIILHCI